MKLIKYIIGKKQVVCNVWSVRCSAWLDVAGVMLLRLAMWAFCQRRNHYRSSALDRTPEIEATKRRLLLSQPETDRNKLVYTLPHQFSAPESAELAYMLSRTVDTYLRLLRKRHQEQGQVQSSCRLEVQCESKSLREVRCSLDGVDVGDKLTAASSNDGSSATAQEARRDE